GRLGMLRVASCDPQQATITTHEVRGRPLSAWLRNPSPIRPLLPWYLAGVWLRAFQQLPVTQSAFDPLTDKDPAGLVEYCDVRLQSIHERGYRWPDPYTHKRLLAVLQRLEDQASEGE